MKTKQITKGMGIRVKIADDIDKKTLVYNLLE